MSDKMTSEMKVFKEEIDDTVATLEERLAAAEAARRGAHRQAQQPFQVARSGV